MVRIKDEITALIIWISIVFALGGSFLLEEEEEEERGKGGEEGKEEEKGRGGWKSRSRLIKSWTTKFEETVTKPTHNV